MNTSSVTNANPPVATYSISTGRMQCLAGGTTYVTAYIGRQWPVDSRCSIYQTFLGNGSLTVAEVKIKQGTSDITGTTHDVIVGQKISLSTDALPSGATVTKPLWTIPGIRIANYTASAAKGEVTALTSSALSSASIIFYWVDGADGRQVQFSCKVNGKPVTAVATFNVKRPTAMVTSVTGQVEVSSAPGYLALHYGKPGAQGIVWTANITPPPGFMGIAQWVQIAYPSRRRQLASTGKWEKNSGSGLDPGGYPYPYGEDSPDTMLTSTYLEKQVNSERFETYLMFKPSVPDDPIWVPLNRVDWSWSGQAVRSGSVWTRASGSNTVNPSGVDTTNFPLWTGIASQTYVPK